MILFLSDSHLGLELCKAKELYAFLQTRDPEEPVFLVGDIFDHSFTHWNIWQTMALREILKFKNLVYLPGNHDAFMRKFSGVWLYQKINIIPDHMFYEPIPGRRYLVIHGDQYDWLVNFTHFMSESWFANRFRRFWHLFHNVMFKYTSHFEKSLCRAAKEVHCEGVICGHSHDPMIDTFDGIEYCNIGDWLHSCSWIEIIDGKPVLKFWKPTPL